MYVIHHEIIGKRINNKQNLSFTFYSYHHYRLQINFFFNHHLPLPTYNNIDSPQAFNFFSIFRLKLYFQILFQKFSLIDSTKKFMNDQKKKNTFQTSHHQE